MRKILFGIVFMTVVHTSGYGQIFLQPQTGPGGLMLKSQLWDLVLTNTTTQSYQAQVEVLISDARSNRKLLSGTTRTILINAGVRHFRYADLMPVTYNLLDPASGMTIDQAGLLPAGEYNVCYIVNATGSGQKVTENCDVLRVDALTPPALQTPEDSATLEEPNPLLTWIPPVPLQIFPRLSYDVRVVVLERTQSGQEAVRKNVPVLEQRDQSGVQLQWPSSVYLDSTKTYAWQVVAKNGGESIAASEVWTFRRKGSDKAITTAQSGLQYYRLEKDPGSKAVLSDGWIRYVFDNELNARPVQILLTDLTTTGLKGQWSDDIILKHGDNYLSLDLREQTVHGHTYLFELRDGNQKWYIRFECRKK